MQVSTRFWPVFQQVVRRQKLMLRIMEAMGVNVPEAMRVDGGLAFLEAQGKCRYCESDDSCRQWLESSEQARGTPEFCPNVSLFDGLKYANLDRERASASRLCPVCRTSMVPEASLRAGQQSYNCPGCGVVVELSHSLEGKDKPVAP